MVIKNLFSKQRATVSNLNMYLRLYDVIMINIGGYKKYTF